MKSLTYSIVSVAASIGALLANLLLPNGELELKTYPKVFAAEFAVMREEALRLVAEEAALGVERFGDSYFELNCRGEPSLLVDNSSSQLLIADPADRGPETPCAQPLHSRWNSRFVPDE